MQAELVIFLFSRLTPKARLERRLFYKRSQELEFFRALGTACRISFVFLFFVLCFFLPRASNYVKYAVDYKSLIGGHAPYLGDEFSESIANPPFSI